MVETGNEIEVTAVPDLGALDELVGYHLRRASATLRSDYARTVEAAGLRQVLFGVLSVISANPGINQGAVGRVLGIQRPNMVALVTELTERGLVTRKADPRDGRAFVLEVTRQGSHALATTLARIREHEERLLESIGLGDREELIQLLRRLADAGGASD
jgi:DNA-binding MarR family transcriptional regulator